MRRFTFISAAPLRGALLVFLLLITACGGYKAPSTAMMMSGGPVIADLAPDSATAGGMAFNMTVNGSGFGLDAVAFWNGSMRGTTYVTGNQLMVGISAADIAMKGVVPVYVRTNGVNSNTVNFTID